MIFAEFPPPVHTRDSQSILAEIPINLFSLFLLLALAAIPPYYS